MGKKLIIKNADFSINAIVSNYELAIGFTDNAFNSADRVGIATSSAFTDSRYANLYNKHISIIELKVAREGVFSVFSYKNDIRTLITTLNFTSDMIGKIVKFPVSIDVEENEMICFMTSTDTGSFYYGRNIPGYTIYTHCGIPGTTPSTLTDYTLCINIYTS